MAGDRRGAARAWTRAVRTWTGAARAWARAARAWAVRVAGSKTRRPARAGIAAPGRGAARAAAAGCARAIRLGLTGAWLAAAGCGLVRGAEEPAPPVGAPAEPAAPAVEPIPVPEAFAAAVAGGTRTFEGRPGPRYWQQRVHYRIDAELDPAAALVRGEETVTYHNRSPDTLGIMVFHLYQNLFRPGAARTREVPVTEGLILERVVAQGVPARRVGPGAPPPTSRALYEVDGTIMVLRLPRPLPPGDSARVELAWRFQVPGPGAPRMGRSDRELFQVAQWYPQVAVYDDVEGWHAWPYLGTGEFYLEYGDFDVSLTVPEGWLVAATGELVNPDEVLTEEAASRLRRAGGADGVIHVVTADDMAGGNATQRAPGGQLTWHFRARDVRDFAFAASDRYLWDATRAVLPGAEGGGPRAVPVFAFYRPEAESWREAARFTREALEAHASVHPYVYPQLTSAEGPVFGMEYPMIMFMADVADPYRLFTLISHETAHQWFPMMVGSKEPEYAWQDEGLATYLENVSAAEAFPARDPWAGDLARYLALAGTDYEKPIMRHADLYGPGPAFVVASYSKPAVLLRALEGVVGEDVVEAALRAYTDRWFLRHPYALDFFNTVEDVAGRDLDWFWRPWWYETEVLDQAITDVRVEPAEGGGERVVVTVEDQGGAPMPVELVLTTAAGETRRVVVPVEVWLRGARFHAEAVVLPGPVERVAIDPDMTFPDVDREDNIWERNAVLVD